MVERSNRSSLSKVIRSGLIVPERRKCGYRTPCETTTFVSAWCTGENQYCGVSYILVTLRDKTLYDTVVRMSQHAVLRFILWVVSARIDSAEPTYSPSSNHQSFYALKQQCLARRRLFEDPDFPPTDASIAMPRLSGVRWRRATEISSAAQFFVDGASRMDICQGALNDCWLLTAATNLTSHPWLFKRVLPVDNSFTAGQYAGIFHFRFWEFGQWVEVVIDDRLPTDANGTLLFGRSANGDEFWSALLEKAYAKFYGSYGALDGGTAREAMQDLTGGLTEFYQPKKMAGREEQLWDILRGGSEMGSLFACNLKSDPTAENVATKDGLLRGHSYSITKVHTIPGLLSDSDNTRLLRIRNPWGNGVEWNGRWSDKSREWKSLDTAERKRVGLTLENDGEFWIELADFMKHFDRLEVCHLSPELHSVEETTGEKESPRGYRWELSALDGQWIRDTTAGGNVSFLDTFSQNPQYTIHVQEGQTGSGAVIALMQKYRRADALPSLTIGFIVYKVTREDLRQKPVPREFFQRNDHAIVGGSIFINAREISCRLTLDAGLYLVIPSTFEPGEEGEYLLRIFTARGNTLCENDAILCFGTLDDRITERGQFFDTPRWALLANAFYNRADSSQQLDQTGLQDVLWQQFFRRSDVSSDSGRFAGQAHKRSGTSPLRKFYSCVLQLCACFWMRSSRNKTRRVEEHTVESQNHRQKEELERIVSLLMSRIADGQETIGYEQFRTVARDVYQWETVFRLYDTDGSGTLDRRELRQALRSSGFNINNRILCRLLRMVVELNRPQIELIDYVLCAAECRHAIVYHIEHKPTYSPSSNHQTFYTLQQQCLGRSQLFEDPDFPPTDASIAMPRLSGVRWRRATEISPAAQFFVDGASRMDICQGALNDCWLLTAATNLTSRPWLFKRVLPVDNSFTAGQYAGIFHFRFWQFGQWVEVVIDDRLPTDANGELLFGRSSEKNEFWSALLEKAYAKFYGSYGALNNGTAREAMQDLTGGLTEFYEPKMMAGKEEQLWDILHGGWEMGSLFACNLKSDPTGRNVTTKDGLLRGHSYSITKIHTISGLLSDSDNTRLLRIRNPWGNGVEWNGCWSDRSHKWKSLDAAERKRIGLTIENDGEFWIELADFMKHFDRLEVCHLSPELHSIGETPGTAQPPKPYRWELSALDGQWIRDTTAGGNVLQNRETFHQNPQYTIHVQDGQPGSGVVIALMQKHRRADGLQSLAIGFIVYKVTREDLRQKPVPREFFQRQDHAFVHSSIFINAREISCRLTLDAGLYLVIPSTFEPGEEGEYLLRIFTARGNTLCENDAILSFGTLDNRITERRHFLETVQFLKLKSAFYNHVDSSHQLDPTGLQEILWQNIFRRRTINSSMSKFHSIVLQLFARFNMRYSSTRRNGDQTGDSPNHQCQELERIVSLLMSRIADGQDTIGYEQFRTVARDVCQWETVFRLYDTDGSGTLDRRELRQALRSSGFHINNRILCRLLRMVEELNRPQIELIDYVLCVAECRHAIDEEVKNQGKY
uniref:Calpain n=1 Tax=Anopheles dirus TaxID=7168 RepID=A0A182N3N5_9DIPT